MPVPTSAPGLDAFHDGLAVLNHEDIQTFLVGQQRRLRHHDLFLRLIALHGHTHELPVS